MRGYTDIPSLLSFTDQKPYGITLPIDKQKELIHGYYAAISYADALVGQLLNTLDSLGLTKNTIIVLWGDHGWHLGDHNLWCKHTNFEDATHAPLIISSPNIKASKTNSASEHIDIFPTLCDLAGLQIPIELDGKSLVPLMKNPAASVKEYSISQYPRSNASAENERLGYADANAMGYSIRTAQYRFTIWMKNGYRSNQPFKNELVIGTELYDYKKDPLETVNVANDKNYATTSKEMMEKMLDFFKSQAK
jgi:arylsulfatase A-like enzyme